MESRSRSRTPLASTGGGHSGRSRGRRTPFSDCTNTAPSPSSSSASTPRRPPKSDPSSASETSRINVCGNAENLPYTHSSSPLESQGEPWTVCTRQTTAGKRKRKGKVVALSASCSPVKGLRTTWNKLNGEKDDDESKSCPVPVTKRQKGHPRKSDKESNALEDYIKQQKSYFAEIDAFELSEEEVAPGEGSD